MNKEFLKEILEEISTGTQKEAWEKLMKKCGEEAREKYLKQSWENNPKGMRDAVLRIISKEC